MNTLFPTLDGCSAEFSDDEVYRYTLTRQWDDGPCVGWILYNPSTATATTDDPTIRKCIGFARRWGFGRLVILNLYSIRGTDPRTPAKHPDPIGSRNDEFTAKICGDADEVVFAWGCAQHMKTIGERIAQVTAIVKAAGKVPVCLGYRGDGHPRHPLMLKYDTPREKFILKG